MYERMYNLEMAVYLFPEAAERAALGYIFVFSFVFQCWDMRGHH